MHAMILPANPYDDSKPYALKDHHPHPLEVVVPLQI